MHRTIAWIAPLALALSANAAAAGSAAKAAPNFDYAVVERFSIGGPGGWDYLTVDPAARRLYISRSDRVVVLDADSGKAVGEIPGTSGVHGIALAPEFKRGYTSNGKTNSVTVFDLATLAVTGTIEVPAQNPDAILYDPASKRVLTFNGRSSDATLIDAATNKVVGNIALRGKPEFAVSDGKGRVYVNIEDKSELAVLDPAGAKVLRSWSLSPCEDPTGLALDEAHQRLFAVCQDKRMVVLDAKSGARIAEVPIDAGPDGVVFDPERGLAFSANGSDGTLTVVHEDDARHFRVLATVPTQKSARTLALDPSTHRIYLSAAERLPPPPATAEQPHPSPSLVPDSFVVLVVGTK